jgi:hypothetical protein
LRIRCDKNRESIQTGESVQNKKSSKRNEKRAAKKSNPFSSVSFLNKVVVMRKFHVLFG